MARDPSSIFAAPKASAVVDSARDLLLELSVKRLLSVDMAWTRMGHDTWEVQRRAEILMRLVASLGIADDNCPSDVFWPTPHQHEFDQHRRTLLVSRDHNGGGPAATVGKRRWQWPRRLPPALRWRR